VAELLARWLEVLEVGSSNPGKGMEKQIAFFLFFALIGPQSLKLVNLRRIGTVSIDKDSFL
jgi:hypothetical protein